MREGCFILVKACHFIGPFEYMPSGVKHRSRFCRFPRTKPTGHQFWFRGSVPAYSLVPAKSPARNKDYHLLGKSTIVKSRFGSGYERRSEYHNLNSDYRLVSTDPEQSELLSLFLWFTGGHGHDTFPPASYFNLLFIVKIL